MNGIVTYLKRERERQERSLSEVARTMGCAKSSLSTWERGIKSPTLDNAIKWAQALNVSLIIWNDLHGKERDGLPRAVEEVHRSRR